jgi:hypothetical protein
VNVAMVVHFVPAATIRLSILRSSRSLQFDFGGAAPCCASLFKQLMPLGVVLTLQQSNLEGIMVGIAGARLRIGVKSAVGKSSVGEREA